MKSKSKLDGIDGIITATLVFLVILAAVVAIGVTILRFAATVECKLCGYDGSHLYRGTAFCYDEDVTLLTLLDEVIERCINATED